MQALSAGSDSSAAHACGGKSSGIARHAWLLPALLWWVAGATHAREKPAHPLFESETALAVTLTAPWSQVMRKAKPLRAYPAVLSYTDAEGAVHRIDATVKARGITRLRLCPFPPLRIRLDPGATHGTIFHGQRSLKLVTHCRNDARHAQYYVQEMLAYRIYTLLTPNSFRVRPLDMTYVDSARGIRDGPRFAFVIEDLADVARRNGHAASPRAQFRPADYDARALTRFMLFQYLIGNTDWDVLSGPTPQACCHNVRVLDSETPPTRLAVPYDFDSAGLVDASYAAPDERLPIESVTERLYRGFCLHNASLGAVREEVRAHRAAILALVAAGPRLSPQRKRATVEYLEAAYAVLDDDARFAREITGKCRK